jgi:hypothetical protein
MKGNLVRATLLGPFSAEMADTVDVEMVLEHPFYGSPVFQADAVTTCAVLY